METARAGEQQRSRAPFTNRTNTYSMQTPDQDDLDGFNARAIPADLPMQLESKFEKATSKRRLGDSDAPPAFKKQCAELQYPLPPQEEHVKPVDTAGEKTASPIRTPDMQHGAKHQSRSGNAESQRDSDEDPQTSYSTPAPQLVTESSKIRDDLKSPSDINPREWHELLNVLVPPTRKRRPRRWLSSDQKTHRCNIDGCTKSYGSASSLCAHKRAHHPGWKERRQEAKEEPSEPGTPVAVEENKDDGEEEFDDDDDEDCEGENSLKPRTRTSHVATLTPELRSSPSGQWLELLAADTHGKLGALRRSRQRAQRAYKEEHERCMVVTDAMGAEGSSVERERLPCAAGMSAGLRLLREMDLKLEKEVQDLEAWLAFVDQMGSAVAAGLLDSVPSSNYQQRLEAVLWGSGAGPQMTLQKLEAAASSAVSTATTISAMAQAALRPRSSSMPGMHGMRRC